MSENVSSRSVKVDLYSFNNSLSFARPMTAEEGKRLLRTVPKGCDGGARDAQISSKDCDYPSLERVHPRLPNVIFIDGTIVDQGAVCSDPNYENSACLVCPYRDGVGSHAIKCSRLYSLVQKRS
jgi:hypothetical protein